MRFKEDQWMFNYSSSDVWYGEYFDSKEEAIIAAKSEENLEIGRSDFYVGQLKSTNNDVHVYADRILENIGEDMYEVVGEVAEDYLRDVKQEHEDILNERLNIVLLEWMKEFNYEPSFFKITNVEKIRTNKN